MLGRIKMKSAEQELKWKKTDITDYVLDLDPVKDQKCPKTRLFLSFGYDTVVVQFSAQDYLEHVVYNRQTGDVEASTEVQVQTPEGKITKTKERAEPVKILENKDKFDLPGLYGKDKGLAKLVMEFVRQEF